MSLRALLGGGGSREKLGGDLGRAPGDSLRYRHVMMGPWGLSHTDQVAETPEVSVYRTITDGCTS